MKIIITAVLDGADYTGSRLYLQQLFNSPGVPTVVNQHFKVIQKAEENGKKILD